MPFPSLAPRPGLRWALTLALMWGLALGLGLPGLGAAPALAETVTVGDFSAGDLAGWEPEEFSGQTQYELVREDGRRVLQARSHDAASGLVKKVDLDVSQAPILRWSWKVAGPVAGGDARKKSGDDYAARVYVVFPSFLFWNTRGINYIWANQLPKGQAVPNTYTSNVIMVAVDSGQAGAGAWVSHERNVYEDYKRLFGEEPPRLGAVAVMTDTDNTHGSATAWYGDITFSSQ